VEIPYDALRADDALAIEFEFDAKDVMGGGMLRPHVDDEFIGTEERIGFLRGVFVDCVSQNFHPTWPLWMPRFSWTQAMSC